MSFPLLEFVSSEATMMTDFSFFFPASFALVIYNCSFCLERNESLGFVTCITLRPLLGVVRIWADRIVDPTLSRNLRATRI